MKVPTVKHFGFLAMMQLGITRACQNCVCVCVCVFHDTRTRVMKGRVMVVHVYMYGANAVPGHQAVMEQLRTMQMEVAFGTFLDQSTTTVQRDLQSLRENDANYAIGPF